MTGNAELDRAIFSILATLLSTWLIGRFRARVKLRYFSPHQFRFSIPNAEGASIIHTATLRVENWGTQKADGIEIFHASRPQQFQMWPPITYTEIVDQSGHHIIKVPSIAPGEGFSVELIATNAVPQVIRIRSDQGDAKEAVVEINPYFPKWVKLLSAIFGLVGLATTLYGLSGVILSLTPRFG